MTILIILLTIAIIPQWLIGILVFYHVVIRSKKPPCDASNRINHIRLFWFSLTRENLFVALFPWLAFDEEENVTQPETAAERLKDNILRRSKVVIEWFRKGDK